MDNNSTVTGNLLYDSLLSVRDETQVPGMARFFKTGPGEYGEGDRFLGIKVPAVRKAVSSCWRRLSLQDLDACMASEYHEVRLGALLCLVQMFSHAGKDPQKRQECVDFYLGHLDGVNNWDLVDQSCPGLLGVYLKDRDRSLLYRLAAPERSLWERRIGIVSTLEFIRGGDLDDTYSISDLFLSDPQPLHDLLQKASGWMLREAGKRDEARLKRYLEPRCGTMPRTMLRYSIERLGADDRRRFMQK